MESKIGSVLWTLWESEEAGGERPVTLHRLAQDGDTEDYKNSFYPRQAADLVEALAVTFDEWAENAANKHRRENLLEMAEFLFRLVDVNQAKANSKSVPRHANGRDVRDRSSRREREEGRE